MANIDDRIEEHNRKIGPVMMTERCIEGANCARAFSEAYNAAIASGDKNPLKVACDATKGEITVDKLIKHWNDFLLIALGSDVFHRSYAFGGVLRDLYDGRMPKDLDVYTTSRTNHMEAVLQCLDNILTIGWRVKVEIVRTTSLYSMDKAAQLRVHAEHHLNPILSISADITFASGLFDTAMDFDVNVLRMHLPLQYVDENSVWLAIGSVSTVTVDDVFASIKAHRMRRICGQKCTEASQGQDERAKKMLVKGYTDVTEYTCDNALCVRASPDAKKRWIEERYASAEVIKNLRKMCIRSFHPVAMKLQQSDGLEPEIMLPMVLHHAIDDFVWQTQSSGAEKTMQLLQECFDTARRRVDDWHRFLTEEEVRKMAKCRIDSIAKLSRRGCPPIPNYIKRGITVKGKFVGSMSAMDIMKDYNKRIESLMPALADLYKRFFA